MQLYFKITSVNIVGKCVYKMNKKTDDLTKFAFTCRAYTYRTEHIHTQIYIYIDKNVFQNAFSRWLPPVARFMCDNMNGSLAFAWWVETRNHWKRNYHAVLKTFLSIKCPATLRWALSWENTDDFCHIYTIYIYVCVCVYMLVFICWCVCIVRV